MVALAGERGAPGSPMIAGVSDLRLWEQDSIHSIRIATPDDLLNATMVGKHRDSSPVLDLIDRPDHVSEWIRIHSTRSSAPDVIKNGLTGPLQFIRKLLDSWNLELIDATGLLGFGPSDVDHVCNALDGRVLIRGRDVADRIAHLVVIRATLRSLFRDLQVENDWLRETHDALDNHSPLSLLLGGSMEDLLFVREYVDAAAGR